MPWEEKQKFEPEEKNFSLVMKVEFSGGLWLEKLTFPSISYYFHIPIIFDYLNIHCPAEVMAVGTINFPVRVGEHFFFQYGLEFIEILSILQVLIRQICFKIRGAKEP